MTTKPTMALAELGRLSPPSSRRPTCKGSTRSLDELVKAMGMSGITKSQVSHLCAEIDERVHAFLDRPIEGDWPYLWIDATALLLARSFQTRIEREG